MSDYYCEKSDVIAWIQTAGHYEELDESDIPDQWLKVASAKIHTWLIEHKVNPTSTKITDKLNLLWAAAITFTLELLCYNEVINWSTGDIALHRLNKVTHQYQRWQPMFFFATGSSKGFVGLLPHETYRMMAYAFCEAYSQKKFFDKYERAVPIPKIVIDRTSRGYDWNIDVETIEQADENISASNSTLNDYDDFDYPLEGD